MHPLASSLYDWSFSPLPIPELARIDGHAGAPEPFPYQQSAAQQIAARAHAYCGHHPGAGKTPIALLASTIYSAAEPVLIVCPPSIVYQWARQAKRWTGHAWYVATTTEQVRSFLANPLAMLPCRFIVPDTLIHEIPDVPCRFALLVVDEAHRLKSNDSRRTKAFYGHGVQRGLRQRSDKVLALSGTPMPNNPTELYPFLHATFPDIAPTFFRFAARYCPPESTWIHTKRGSQEILVYRNATNKDELARKLRETCMIRPKRDDILGQLPPVRFDVLPIKIGGKHDMSAEECIKVWNHGSVDQKKALSTTRMHLGEAKAEKAQDYLETVMDGGDSPIIWCWHRSVAEIVAQALQLPVIHGAKTPEERRDAIDAFVGGAKGLVATLQAAGTGIDGLQDRTDLAIFLESDFVPLTIEQAIGRLQRIGQRKPVRVVDIMSDHPIDHAMEASRNRKNSDIAEIVG